MRNAIAKIFGKEKGIIIGAVHFPPLPEHAEFPGFAIAEKNALADTRAFEEGGVDGIIFENNYDIPHNEFVTSETAEAMMRIGKEIRSATTLSIGVSVLWNDYKTALLVAKEIGALFIRVPVFIDIVETDYGIIKGNSEAVVAYRNELKVNHIALFTDIHVKHSKLLSPFSIEESARLAIQNGSDGLIVTGAWTGKAPDLQKLERVRNTVGDFPILCGSGVDEKNIRSLFQIANGAIVSTSLKVGNSESNEVNIKPYQSRIDIKKVKELTEYINKKRPPIKKASSIIKKSYMDF